MVKSYRKYEQSATFGLVNTALSNLVWTPDNLVSSSSRNTGAGRAYVGANEHVLAWDVKKGELVSRWHDVDCKSQVSAIAQCLAQPDLFAVGYQDGSIRVWDALSNNPIMTFNGHRSAITHLTFDSEGARLASGAKDTDIIIWNLLSETAEFRLRGHKDQITGLHFIRTRPSGRQSPHTDEAVDVTASGEPEEFEEKYLLSTSKDALIKIWDLSTPQCIETHVAQTNGECWALGVSPDGMGCITAGNDGELKVWSLDLESLADFGANIAEAKQSSSLTAQGILLRQSKDRTLSVAFHPKGEYIAVHGSEKAVEIWRIRTDEEVQKSLARKRKRRREKAAAAGASVAEAEKEDENTTPDVSEVFVSYVIVRTGGKVRSAAWAASRSSKNVELVCSTTNNQIESYTITGREKSKKATADAPDYNRALAVDMPGHRTDIRALALSSDDRMLASASAGLLKIWNVKTQSCLRTLECGQSLCCTFLPGDKIVLVGTKTGELELYDIASSALIDKFQAHDGAVWTLQVHPDGTSVVTGGADKAAKFWKFDIVQEEIPGTRRTTPKLKLTQTRVLKVADDVLSVCFSPDSRLLALSTLDNTVKVFFVDTLKLFLTLYGHKLPVLNISISSDSKLIATCSADKNVRIWGLDFGDCHKAFFAHQDSVMQVLFIPHPVEKEEQHLFFSASKDSVVKTWDGDKFEQIQKLEGHHGEVWAMVVSRTGEKVITASHDKSIRVWDVTDDLIFLEEEREKELEQMYESTLATQLDKDHADDDEGAEDDVAAASKQTIATLTYGERILEALELGYADYQVVQAWQAEKATKPNLAPPQRNPVFTYGNLSAEQHVLQTIRKIPNASLNDALMVVPFSSLPVLFMFVSVFIQRRMQPSLAWRVFYFLLQTHNSQIAASKQLKDVLGEVLEAYGQFVKEEKNMLGFNMAALNLMGREIKEAQSHGMEDEQEEEKEEKLERGTKKRAFASIA
ncbi:WD40 repeat-like protein [Aureobasidium pullulans]|nr:WD40 repeat-like protein [Aureobasidium pullulans]